MIVFVIKGAQIRTILDHIGVERRPPHIFAARSPHLWETHGDALGWSLGVRKSLAEGKGREFKEADKNMH